MIVNPHGDQITIKADIRGSLPPFCLEGKADGLVLGKAREAMPLLDAEAKGVFNTTTNPEGGPGESPEVHFSLWFVCVVPRFPPTNLLELALLFLEWLSPPPKGEAGDRDIPQEDLEEQSQLSGVVRLEELEEATNDEWKE